MGWDETNENEMFRVKEFCVTPGAKGLAVYPEWEKNAVRIVPKYVPTLSSITSNDVPTNRLRATVVTQGAYHAHLGAVSTIGKSYTA